MTEPHGVVKDLDTSKKFILEYIIILALGLAGLIFLILGSWRIGILALILACTILFITQTSVFSSIRAKRMFFQTDDEKLDEISEVEEVSDVFEEEVEEF